MSTDERRRALQRDIERRLALCSLDELRVLDVILGRAELGRERYGELHISRDRRDWKRERAEELVDAEFYDACDLLQRRDAERAELYEAVAREEVARMSDADLDTYIQIRALERHAHIRLVTSDPVSLNTLEAAARGVVTKLYGEAPVEPLSHVNPRTPPSPKPAPTRVPGPGVMRRGFDTSDTDEEQG